MCKSVSHRVLGGDFNTDFNTKSGGQQLQPLNSFLEEHGLQRIEIPAKPTCGSKHIDYLYTSSGMEWSNYEVGKLPQDKGGAWSTTDHDG